MVPLRLLNDEPRLAENSQQRRCRMAVSPDDEPAIPLLTSPAGTNPIAAAPRQE